MPFDDWKGQLISSAGDAGLPVRRLGDYVLELFWRDGCEPTLAGLFDYAQAGLCERHAVRVSHRPPDRASTSVT